MVPPVQSPTSNISTNPHTVKPKEEQKQEKPKEREIIPEQNVQEENSDKEEKEKYENKRTNQMPSQPYWTHMIMYPYGMNNPNDGKPPMVFMIPMYCFDPRSIPHGFPMPPMQPMPNMQFPFYNFQPFGMNMQNK